MEAIGDIVTGGLAASAVDGAPAHQAGGHGGRCLNCGQFLAGAYCSGCGQTAHVHRSVAAFGHDFAHGVLHFEGKLWRTLPLLFWRPGVLTRRYINGERARYFSPLALFLFSVFLTFGVLSLVGIGLNANNNPLEGARRQTMLNEAGASLRADMLRTTRQIADARAAGLSTAALEKTLADQRTAARLFGVDANGMPASGRENRFSITDAETGVPALDRLIANANADPAMMLYKLQGNAYKFAWALIPLSAPFLWLLYPFSRRFGIYDHLVFVTYSISTMLLLLVVLRLLGLAAASVNWEGGGAIVALISLFYPPIHIYKQLRGTYRSGRFMSAVHAILLVCFAIVILMAFMALLLALGALGGH